MLKGQLQAFEVNNYGYPRIKVSGAWYGSDKKGTVSAKEGDLVEFEAFKNAKGYDTFKFQSFKKVANAVHSEPVGGSVAKESQGSPGTSSRGNFASQQGSRDSYWSDKAKSDEAKDPRIAYFAASERAIQFCALALQHGALDALAKAKATSKLEIIEAFVDEQTQRLLIASYAQKVPFFAEVGAEAKAAPVLEAGDPDETWK